MDKVCIVHDRKYLSKFYETINQLRRLNEFAPSILQQLPKRCCSCDGKDGESSFTIDHLRQLCRKIQSSKAPSEVTSPPPVKAKHCVILEYSPMLTLVQRVYKCGRFVGRKGEHLRLLERTLNIQINILNHKSSKDFRQIVSEFRNQNSNSHLNDLWVLITLNNDNDGLEKIKQSLENAWKGINVTTRAKKPRSARIVLSPSLGPPLTSISGDTPWKPKKYKSKLNQKDEGKVPPQPLVPPISMPKKIIKRQKNKRK